MITRIAVRNWQSLRKLDLALGRFTVIVGASSSGKSALMRALRAVASNTRGTSQLTRGATTGAVTVALDDGETDAEVTLEHLSGAWRYRTVVGGREATYTKLAGQVPTQITELLRINPVPSGGTSLNFASQFDPPYLLTDSGATVARILGELTNLDTILAAVREANRRRTAATSALKHRESDLGALKEQLGRFTGLKARQEAAETAEERLDVATYFHLRAQRLQAALDTLEAARQVLARVRVPQLPDLAPVDAAHTRYHRLVELLRQRAALDADLVALQTTLDDLDAQLVATDAELHQTLLDAGECPTCGQQVTP